LRYSKIKKNKLSIRTARESLRCSAKALELTEYIPASGRGIWFLTEFVMVVYLKFRFEEMNRGGIKNCK
jgi:hypothetical protein